MDIFIIGGLTDSNDNQDLLERSMHQVGRDLFRSGHNLLICSPFVGTADVSAVRGAASVVNERDDSKVVFHYPSTQGVMAEISKLRKDLGLDQPRLKNRVIEQAYLPLPDSASHDRPSPYGWLLAQLAASDKSQAIITIGGKLTGPANLLLALAESKQKPLLPLSFLGGAAADSFERLHYRLQDQIGHKVSVLRDPSRIAQVVPLLEEITSGQFGKYKGSLRFFISYPRSRPQEADFIETILRRRKLRVDRDEHDFAAGRPLPHEIQEHIHQATVFIALWCREYACSPWCFDELELALSRAETGAVELWLLCIDDTRMIPTRARNLVSYVSSNREELERNVLSLLDRLSNGGATE